MRKICALFVIHYLCSCNVFGILVTTEKGIVSGIKLVSRSGAPFYAYFAIPYAKPPVGELRFQPPQEPDKWDGIRDGAFPKFRCTQYDKFFHFNGVIGSEDCLYLNVFTPMVYSEANLPVMVCIHGGAFFRGDSAECFPSYFMDKKVLVVTFNYRLGILGFLSAADQVLPGNYGMKDQVAVLHWVRRNIKAFGGNPNCVTIFGESAGGASVHLHMYSSLSKGLFHRAISQSGSATVPWAIVPPVMSKNRTLTLGILTGCPLSSTKNLVYCLRKLPAENLAALLLRYYVWNDKPTVLFPVVIEPDIEGAFLTKKPLYGEELIQVPWIIGITSGEGGYVAAEYLSNDGLNAREFNENFKRYIPIVFCFYYTAELYLLESISQKIKEFYFQDKDIGFRTAFELRDMVTDGAFAHNIIKSALHYKGDRYFYYYDHLNERSFNEVWGGSSTMKFLGVSHGDDLISLFPQMWTFPSILNGRDLIVSVKMINYWTNFAHNGHPNDDQVCQSRWEPVTSSDLEFLHIDGVQDKMSKKLLFDRYSFWETLPLNGAEEGYQTFATLLIDSVQNFSTSLQDMEYHRDEL